VLDPSNADPRFDRAALRKRLDGVDWIDAEAAARSAAALAEAEAALIWTVAGLAATHIHPSTDAWVLDRTDLPRELLRRLLIEMLCSADPEIVLPRGEALDRAIAAARAGRQASLGDWLLRGGAVWTLSPAPPRR
jgi:tRNA(Ile)-lysidine synthase